MAAGQVHLMPARPPANVLVVDANILMSAVLGRRTRPIFATSAVTVRRSFTSAGLWYWMLIEYTMNSAVSSAASFRTSIPSAASSSMRAASMNER